VRNRRRRGGGRHQSTNLKYKLFEHQFVNLGRDFWWGRLWRYKFTFRSSYPIDLF